MFKVGDRVEMTTETMRWNPRTRSSKGVIVKVRSETSILVHRDGLKNADEWHPAAWQREGEAPVAQEEGDLV